MAGRALPAVASALAVLAAGSALLIFPIGPMSAHMLLHIALMNVLAPLLAALLVSAWPGPDRAALVWVATIAQILLLWFWHAPPVHRAATESLPTSLIMHLSLLAAAFVFWMALIRLPARNVWQAIFALLITSKLACLLGVLLSFAPRTLYGDSHVHGYDPVSQLDDQQLAGLYMMTACPLSFVLAGVIIASQVLNDFERQAPTLAK